METVYNNIPFMNEMFTKLNIRQDALEYFTRIEEKILADSEMNKEISEKAHEFMTSEKKDFGALLTFIDGYKEKLEEHSYTLYFLITMRCLPYLREQYENDNRLTEEMFWQGVDDMRCKLNECLEMHGIYGSSVAGWFGEMLVMKRFALGRFQYIVKRYEAATFKTPYGHIIEKDSYLAEFHIPSSGVPLKDEIRNDSYRQAWKFFKDMFGTNRVVLRCTSWLLYPEQYRFLPPHSNILKFMDDFDLPFYAHFPDFHDAWRLFGKSSEKPLEEWDEKTSLQKAYKKRLLEGKPTGDAMGFIIMEGGENVTKVFKSPMYKQEKIRDNRPFMNEMFEKLNMNKDALAYFTKLEEQIMADPKLDKIFTDAAHDQMMCLYKDYDPYMRLMERTSEEYGIHEYTLKFLFAMRCLPYLREQYRQTEGYTEEMFWQNADDLRCKLDECIDMFGIYGSSCGGWFGDMLTMKRVALGRFQYMPVVHNDEGFTTPSGRRVEKGDFVGEIHIPSSGVPLTEEVRNDSYRKAWEFFSKLNGKNKVVLRCSSWILYEGQKEFLPEKSNLRGFIDDFHITNTFETPDFHDSWRLFGKSSQKPLEEWDEKTSLQKAYKKHLLEGKFAGESRGFIIMENGVNVTK